MKRPRPKSRPILVSDLIARFLNKKEGRAHRGKEALAMKVFAAFQKIGPPVTDFAEPAFFRGGVLTLRVSSSAWMTELSLLQTQILNRLERLMGRKAVKEIRLRMGDVRRPDPEPPPAKPLTHKQAEDVQSWAAHIQNPDVRAAMISAASRSLASGPPPGRPFTGPPGPARTPPKIPEDQPVERPRYGYGFRARRDRWKEE